MSRAVVPLILFVASGARAADPDPLDLMKQSDKRHRLAHERTEGSMILQKVGGDSRTRTLVTLSAQNEAEGDKMLIRFGSPADIEGTAFLSLEDPKTHDTEQWLYLPAFRKTRRVGKAELGDRFVNSDIFFEDLQAREIEDYNYEILKSEKVDGHDCWVIESKPSAPKAKKESPYGKSHLWMRKDNLFVVKGRHFDRRMRPLKELTSGDAKKVKGDAWRADKVTIVDIKRKHRTVLIVSERNVADAIPASEFSQHRLGAD